MVTFVSLRPRTTSEIRSLIRTPSMNLSTLLITITTGLFNIKIKLANKISLLFTAKSRSLLYRIMIWESSSNCYKIVCSLQCVFLWGRYQSKSLMIFFVVLDLSVSRRAGLCLYRCHLTSRKKINIDILFSTSTIFILEDLLTKPNMAFSLFRIFCPFFYDIVLGGQHQT